jgi:RNA polymerase sigma-70 factor (ECF subfamily)
MINSEEDIIKGCLKRKHRAQKQLYKRYYNKMFGICLRYCAFKDEAEDMVLDGFFNIFTKIHLYKRKGPFEAWMRKIMINTAIDHYRKNLKFNGHASLDELGYEQSIKIQLLDNLTSDKILETVQQLPEGYRMVFNLYAIEGYAHKEIAELLGISKNTSKTQLLKARKYLQKKLLELDKNING